MGLEAVSVPTPSCSSWFHLTTQSAAHISSAAAAGRGGWGEQAGRRAGCSSGRDIGCGASLCWMVQQGLVSLFTALHSVYRMEETSDAKTTDSSCCFHSLGCIWSTSAFVVMPRVPHSVEGCSSLLTRRHLTPWASPSHLHLSHFSPWQNQRPLLRTH